MKNSRVLVNTFSFGILASSCVLSPFVLDFTLLARFISCTLFFLFVVYFLYRSGFSFKLNVDLVLLSYFSYVLFCCLSLVWALNKAEAFFEASKIMLAFLTFLFSYFSFQQQYDLFIKRLRKISVLLFYFTFAGACFQFSQINTSMADWHYSITGLNGHKNLYASFLFLNLFFLISALFHLTKSWRFFAWVAFVLSISVLVFLRTKAVWLGSLTGLLIYGVTYLYKPKQALLQRKDYVLALLGVLVANLFFLFALPPLIQSGIHHGGLQEAKELVDTERLMLWDKTNYMVHHHPLFGVGVGNWQVYFPDATLSGLWRAEDLNYTFQRPHNDFLWILSQTGIVGFNLFLVFLISVLGLLIRVIPFVPKARFKEISCCLAVIAGYYTISFFDFPMERVEHAIWINVLLGFAYYQIRKGLSLKALLSLRLIRAHYALILFLVLGMLALGVLRYRGELNTRHLYDAKKAGNPDGVIKAGVFAKNAMYTLDPTSVPIDWYVGNAHAALGNYAEAQRCFFNAYSLNPYNRNVLNDLASSYSVNNNQDSAKILYEEASRISPRFDDPKLNLAAIYMGEGNYQKAAGYLSSLYHNSERRSQYQKIVDAVIKK